MRKIMILAILLLTITSLTAREHPSLLITKEGVAMMRGAQGKIPAFDATMADVKSKADLALSSAIEVPVPKDGGGGPTHEKHKDNYYSMYYCGIMYQVTGDKKYAQYVEKMLDAYLELYPKLGYHPVKMSSNPGRLFWQTLNDFVWLVHTSVAYDCIYDYLPAAKRERFNEELFKPMAHFLMDGSEANEKIFNKMHNHGTWACAAVGMIGYVMGDKELINKSLYGTDGTGKNGGFLQQLEELFSPDGYFTEGPYYQRYAIWPFMLFAQAINNNEPGRKIFAYRDSILKKAGAALMQMTYEGVFFRLNDALDKGFSAQELIFADNILYSADTTQKYLLDISKRYQSFFIPTDAGFRVARDIAAGEAVPFRTKSLLLRDGSDGTQGGLAIFRSPGKKENATFLMKATSHGLSHGHFDKLTIAYYDDGNPVLTDYGSSRFINVVVKYNGGYTPLNDSFSMSTIAHNTVSVDFRNHYDGDIKISSKYAPSIYCYDAGDPEVQVFSAIETNAAPGVVMRRTNAFIENLGGERVILDIFSLRSSSVHNYDLPFFYKGDMISLSVPYEKAGSQMNAFGNVNGYRYLWQEAYAKPYAPQVCFTLLNGKRFYSITTVSPKGTELFFVRTGANDPEYYLRSEPGYVVRMSGSACHTFVSAIETHGNYDLIVEKTENPVSGVKYLKVLEDDANHTVVAIDVNGERAEFTICYSAKEGEKKWSYKKL